MTQLGVNLMPEVGHSIKIRYSTVLVTDDDDLEFVRPHMTYRLVDSPPAVRESDRDER